MSRIPSAWDDDWEQTTNTAPSASTPAPKILSRTERKAAHAEANKKLWEAAEQPERPFFLETKSDVPLKNEFKPQMKVLSRKPSPQVAGAAQGTTTAGAAQDEDDSEEEERRRAAESFAERQQRAAREREEKQRKYAEARERIMGTGTGTNAAPSSSAGSGARQQPRRGGIHTSRNGSRQGSSAEQSPARASQPQKTLFDPSYASKPSDGRPSPRSGTPNQEQPIRMPRGPDSNARGGFAPRGGRGG